MNSQKHIVIYNFHKQRPNDFISRNKSEGRKVAGIIINLFNQLEHMFVYRNTSIQELKYCFAKVYQMSSFRPILN